MNSKLIKMQRNYLVKENKKWPRVPVQIPSVSWPPDRYSLGSRRIAVWRSNKFFIQQFAGEHPGITRLSINRAAINSNGDWRDDISWDELQWIKNAVGFGDLFAVEIYPADIHVVNVANMRHLWVFDKPPDFGWRK